MSQPDPENGEGMTRVRSGWKWFRGRSTRFQVLSWIVVAVLVLAGLGSGGGSDKTAAATTPDKQPSTTSAKSNPTKSNPTKSTQPTTASGDTGRMDAGE